MAGSRVSETRMHWVRWLLTTGWLLIIASLFFDPFTARFTSPDHPWSPLRLADKCVAVQGRCLVESPYPLGTTIFWGAVVPAGIFILLVFGHELWRRICPLSFISQIPRALGRQRQTAKRNPKTGEIRHQLARVPPDSWLAKHYPFLQFGWLYSGLCGRILFFNADRLVLASWLLFTIAAAVTVGWLYGGKAWCQYFYPMALAWVHYLFDMALVATSSLWLVRNWHRSPALYGRENLAERFRRQLQKLGLDVGRFLEGRSLDDLNTDEVYVLARILPGFGSEQRHEAYKGVVRDALAEGYVNISSSLEVLRRMRQELGISDDEHRQLLDALGVEDPALLDPDQRRSLEDQVRLSGYRRSLERLLRLQSRIGTGSDGGGGGGGKAGDAALLDSIGSQYSISAQEEARILEAVSPAEAAQHRAEMLLQRLEDLGLAARSLSEPLLLRHQPAPVALLADRLRLRQELCLSAILDCLVQLQSAAERQQLLDRLSVAAPPALPELLAQDRWRTKLPAALIDRLLAGNRAGVQPGPDLPVAATLQQLERLAQDPDPIAATAAVVPCTSLDWQRGRSLAAALAASERPAWVRTTAEQLLALQPPQAPAALPLAALPLAALPEFEKRVVLATSDFFHRTWTDTLDLLADHAEIRSFAAGEAITAAGDSCRELLLLIEGEARVEERSGDQVRFRALRAGQVLDELEVLTHSNSENTIVAETAGTRVLAVPVDCFDATLERDPDFARRVLALETRQLQRVTRELPVAPLG